MKENRLPEHTLEFLLAFDGRTHWMESGHRLKFEIRRVPITEARPHGLHYSFTLHDPEGRRIMGFDNAHTVAVAGSRFKERPVAHDHWHRTEDDTGRVYSFVSADKLLADFFREVRRVLETEGLTDTVVQVEERRTP